MDRFVLIIFLTVVYTTSYGQGYVFNLPQMEDWYLVEEGDSLEFDFQIVNRDTVHFDYRLIAEEKLNIHLDSVGHFLWIPSYELVSRVENEKGYSVILEAHSKDKKVTKELRFTVLHKNRPPQVESLPVFYVKQYTRNEFNLNKMDQIRDLDDDPVVFIADQESMPENATLSELGTFSWQPTRNQFRRLYTKPITVKFTVQDQPAKLETTGEFRIAPTQQDIPPDILIVPSDSLLEVKEDEVVNLNLYVTDPNGDDNIMDVGFVANNLNVPKDILTKNTATQWEFKWTPGYDFVDEEGETDVIQLTFFALDRTGQKTDKSVAISITDAENIVKKDKRLYDKYRMMLVATMNLINQLDANQKNLNKLLKKAKKGKKHRSIVNASLGAITGVSPVFLEDDSRDYVTGIGGTTVLTLGTLEATEVVGRSKDDILDKLKINIDIRNQLQAEGDRFARKYALKVKRRDKEFNLDIDKLKAELNNKKLILLELPADWENPRQPTDNNLKRTFPDFNSEGFDQQ